MIHNYVAMGSKKMSVYIGVGTFCYFCLKAYIVFFWYIIVPEMSNKNKKI